MQLYDDGADQFKSYSCQVNGSWCNVNVHQVVHNARLNVTFVFVHHDFFAGIVDRHVGQLFLLFFVEQLVFLLVVFDAKQKVRQCRFDIHVCVVWAAYFHFLQRKNVWR